MADRGAVKRRRPLALTIAQGLWFLTVLPFLGLAMVTTLGAPERKQEVAAELPRLVVTVLAHRASGVLLWFAAISFLLATAFAGPGRQWARTVAVTLTGLYDAILVMVLLGDQPRLMSWAGGAAVVLASLAAVVLSYQPEVERYLASRTRAFPQV